MPAFEFDGRTLNYQTFGNPDWAEDAPVFVVLSTEFRDASELAVFFDEFPDTVSGILLDNTNMGASTRLDRPLTADEILAEATFACEQLRIKQPVFVGYCSTAELAMHCARHTEGSAAVLISPLVRKASGGFIEFFYAVMKRAILDSDAYTLAAILNLVNPHSTGIEENRNHFLKDQFIVKAAMSDPERFWVQTLQNKPKGLFDWETVPDWDTPILVVRGSQDALQPTAYLHRAMRSPQHHLVEIDNGHMVLNDKLHDVMKHMCAFSATVPGELKRLEVTA